MCKRSIKRSYPKKERVQKFEEGQKVEVIGSLPTKVFEIESIVKSKGEYLYEDKDKNRYEESVLQRHLRVEKFYVFFNPTTGQLFEKVLTENLYSVQGHKYRRGTLTKLPLPPVQIGVEWDEKPEYGFDDDDLDYGDGEEIEMDDEN